MLDNDYFDIWLRIERVMETKQTTLTDIDVLLLMKIYCQEQRMSSANYSWRDHLGATPKNWSLGSLFSLFNRKWNLSSVTLLSCSSGVSLLFSSFFSSIESEISEESDDVHDSLK